jgi:hypothetical protein
MEIIKKIKKNKQVDIICNNEYDPNNECIGCKRYKKCNGCKQYFCMYLVTGFPPNIFRKKYLHYCDKCNLDFKPEGRFPTFAPHEIYKKSDIDIYGKK